jgi:tetratricopeptide (TPR) repeat protein
MPTMLRSILTLLVVAASALNIACAHDINLLPKYGSMPKDWAQQEADNKLIAAVDEYYKGNRKKASEEISARGWQFLRQHDINNAMRLFNKAWLIDSSNGIALWGMAAIQTNSGKTVEALKLFAEAECLIDHDINFSIEHAKAIGIAAVETGDKILLEDAFNRFARVYKRSPQNVLNLQNWAITLYSVGKYAEAWTIVQRAEASARSADLDQNFIMALQNKMPRPTQATAELVKKKQQRRSQPMPADSMQTAVTAQY